jgi:hypothetical protein
MESSRGGGLRKGKGVWALLLEKRDKTEGIWVDLSIRLVSDLQKSGRAVESLYDISAWIRLVDSTENIKRLENWECVGFLLFAC